MKPRASLAYAGDERARIRARSLLPQRHDRQDAEDADGDEGALDEACGDVAEGEAFVLA